MFTNLQNNNAFGGGGMMNVTFNGGLSSSSSFLSSCNNNNNNNNIKFHNNKNEEERKSSSTETSTAATTTTTTNTTNNNNMSMMSDAELAKEMMELSVKEREKVLDDIHGVALPYVETTDFISHCIYEFAIALKKISKSKKKALERAYFLKPSLIYDTKFKLMFLRSDNYDPKKASYRMCRYYENKRNLFGDDLLARTIKYNDLSKQEIQFFERGSIIELKQRDQTGRPIWFVDINRCDWNNPISLFRCSWYLMMSTVENDDIAQKRGVCQVVYHNHSNNKSNNWSITKIFETIIKSGDLFTSLPIRVTSSHQCYENPNPSALKILSAMRIAFGKELRLRMKVHFGTEIEIDYSLLTFGIIRRTTTSNSSSSSSSNNNNDSMESLFQEYKQRRIEIEEQEELKNKENNNETVPESSSSSKSSSKSSSSLSSQNNIIIFPNPEDVLVGRGRPYHEYSGNIKFTKLIDSLLDQYEACGDDHFAKTCLTINVVKSVQEEYGGRFLLRQTTPTATTSTSSTTATTTTTTTKSKKSSKGNNNNDNQNNINMGWVLADNTIARQKAASAFRSKILAKCTTTTTTNNNNSNNNNNNNNASSQHHHQQQQQQSKHPRTDQQQQQMMLMMMQQQQQQQQQHHPPTITSSSSSSYHNHPQQQQKQKHQKQQEQHYVANKRPRFFL